ncbi:uncharacterized protein ACIBXB_016346 isoform 1-T1 [Morphnus guianensis]
MLLQPPCNVLAIAQIKKPCCPFIPHKHTHTSRMLNKKAIPNGALHRHEDPSLLTGRPLQRTIINADTAWMAPPHCQHNGLFGYEGMQDTCASTTASYQVLTFQKTNWYNIHCKCGTYYHKSKGEEREHESMHTRTFEQQERKGLLRR